MPKNKVQKTFLCLSLIFTVIIFSGCANNVVPPSPIPDPPTLTPNLQPTIPSPQPPTPSLQTPVPSLQPPTTNPQSPTPSPRPPTAYGYEIINVYPHDPNAFTQGLHYEDGYFYEGTGLWGQSNIRQVDAETGDVLQQVDLPEQYFGEGIVVWQDKIIQITWRSQVAFVYDKENFGQIGEFNYQTEGWGITHDGEHLIMSDGSHIITFRDPDSFEAIGQIETLDRGMPIDKLNELEYINGEIWANVWLTDQIVRISPETGEVVGWIDLAGIYPDDDPANPDDVLNGIAYDQETDRLFVTGKLWNALYEIRLIE